MLTDEIQGWGSLSLAEKAKIIQEAVSHGVYNLNDIRSSYNDYMNDEGGDFKDSAFTPSTSINEYAYGGHMFLKGGKTLDTNQRGIQAVQFFMDRGLTREQAAGLVGNLIRESRLNHRVTNKSSGAVGIGQWLGDRKKALFRRYGNNPSFENQLDYIWYELNTTHKNGLRQLKAAKTVDEAAAKAFGYYEFSAGPEGAMAAMDRHGRKGTGRASFNQGIVFANDIYDQHQRANNQRDNITFIAPELASLKSDEYIPIPPNPTDYGTPVDYGNIEKTTAAETLAAPAEEQQNRWALLRFLQDWNAPQQTAQPTNTSEPIVEASAPFVVEVPSASTTTLTPNWLAKGGPLKKSYSDWKKAVEKHKDIHPDKDKTYDYEGFYNKYPAQAWAMLKDDPNAHFTDEFKTVYHPSFSNQSRYSGIVDERFNPEGVIGGPWSEDGKKYTLSEDQAKHRWDIGNTMDYFGRAEDNGVQGFYPDGRHWTTADGVMWGGTLPAVTVTPKRKARGGHLFEDGGIKNHNFTWDSPVEYNGTFYPSAMAMMDGKQVLTFVANDGSVWYLDDEGQPQKMMYKHELPEAEVFPTPTFQDLQKMQRDDLTLSNDATAIYSNRLLNSHLQNKAIRGANKHAAWEEEHPNLTKWGYVAGALPFAVAGAPFVAGLGDMAAGTAIGQGMTGALTTVTNAAQGSTWLPWLDAAATSYFGAHGLNEIVHGNVSPEAVMEVLPLSRLGRPMYEASRSGAVAHGGRVNSVSSYSQKNEKPKVFKSELDWSPENWFGTRISGAYDAEDVAALQSHVPEYLGIEQQAKTNGTWLKMPDGSTWEGDPRSWVQLQSKTGQQLTQKPFYHGNSDSWVYPDGRDVTAERLGEGVLWTSSNKFLPITYGNNHYTLSIPKSTKMPSVDAQGHLWNGLSKSGYRTTNEVSYSLLRDNNAVEIKNVIDAGGDARWRAGKDGLPPGLSGEKVDDYFKRVFIGNDYILGPKTPRKSLLGNNGDFNLLNPNLYKAILPFGVMAPLYNGQDK